MPSLKSPPRIGVLGAGHTASPCRTDHAARADDSAAMVFEKLGAKPGATFD